MASLIMATPFPASLTQSKKTSKLSVQRAFKVTSMQTPLEELYNVKVERKVSQRRLDELGVSRWSVWKTGKCKLPWDWQVDQLVYIEEGEVRVVRKEARANGIVSRLMVMIDLKVDFEFRAEKV
ncbi:hypothetical protein Bca52824_028610 [Brassica carinata]|uniref:(S)-ureidoglycine aminohydrolase cupin domain-containing protein n=2 Tax=Brassica carinata TaxID=52824 RepID=A0A8X8ARW4_BRACI|nr:hypothetical protein Bca52824_028610 [Brassica carinata]